MKTLSKDQILGTRDKIMIEPVKAFGGEVHVRNMTGKERDSWEQEITDNKNAGRNANLRGALAARSICDEKGTRLFTDKDSNQLGELSAKDLDIVFDVGLRLSGLDKKTAKELEKN